MLKNISLLITAIISTQVFATDYKSRGSEATPPSRTAAQRHFGSDLCVRVKTSPDFWDAQDAIRGKKEFKYDYEVEVRFKDGAKERVLTLGVPSEGGVALRGCLPKDVVGSMLKRQHSAISDISATVKAVPHGDVVMNELVETGTMYIPAKGMKEEHKTTKVIQSFNCTPNKLNGPFMVSKMITDDITINIGNDSEIFMKWTKSNLTHQGDKIHDYTEKGLPLTREDKSKIYATVEKTPVVPLKCTMEVLTQE